MSRVWIGVDLDGTLAHSDGPRDENLIGEPIPVMVMRVKEWIASGHLVKVFTARMSEEPETWAPRIARWTKKHIGIELEATCRKDYWCIQIWDDIAVGVVQNTGEFAIGE